MKFENTSVLNVGDWVKGKSMNGELIVGFVEYLSPLEEKVILTVAVSDNEELIGEAIKLPLQLVERAPVSDMKDRNLLLSLIDLALATGDKEWFDELSEELNSLKQPVTK